LSESEPKLELRQFGKNWYGVRIKGGQASLLTDPMTRAVALQWLVEQRSQLPGLRPIADSRLRAIATEAQRRLRRSGADSTRILLDLGTGRLVLNARRGGDLAEAEIDHDASDTTVKLTLDKLLAALATGESPP
jgi:hypothetical protein